MREVHIDKKDTHSDFDDTHREKIGKDTVDLFMTENGQNTFSEVSEKEITVVIHKLKNFSSPGSDRIGSLIIKHGGKNLHNLIKLVLNATFQLGYFPNAWKFDNRIYLNKSGKESYHGPKSYRSISLTNTLGKILERIFLSGLLSGLEENNFFQNKNLFAYIKFHSTSHAIIPLIEDVSFTKYR